MSLQLSCMYAVTLSDTVLDGNMATRRLVLCRALSWPPSWKEHGATMEATVITDGTVMVKLETLRLMWQTMLFHLRWIIARIHGLIWPWNRKINTFTGSSERSHYVIYMHVPGDTYCSDYSFLFICIILRVHYVKEPNEFFVMTNLWKTCNQTQGVCAEVRYTHSHAHTHSTAASNYLFLAGT